MDVSTARQLLRLGARGYIPKDETILARFRAQCLVVGHSRDDLYRALTTIADYRGSDFLRQYIPDKVFKNVQNLVFVKHFAKQASYVVTIHHTTKLTSTGYSTAANSATSRFTARNGLGNYTVRSKPLNRNTLRRRAATTSS